MLLIQGLIVNGSNLSCLTIGSGTWVIVVLNLHGVKEICLSDWIE